MRLSTPVKAVNSLRHKSLYCLPKLQSKPAGSGMRWVATRVAYYYKSFSTDFVEKNPWLMRYVIASESGTPRSDTRSSIGHWTVHKHWVTFRLVEGLCLANCINILKVSEINFSLLFKFSEIHQNYSTDPIPICNCLS